jgi:hypothetical protein
MVVAALLAWKREASSATKMNRVVNGLPKPHFVCACQTPLPVEGPPFLHHFISGDTASTSHFCRRHSVVNKVPAITYHRE